MNVDHVKMFILCLPLRVQVQLGNLGLLQIYHGNRIQNQILYQTSGTFNELTHVYRDQVLSWANIFEWLKDCGR